MAQADTASTCSPSTATTTTTETTIGETAAATLDRQLTDAATAQAAAAVTQRHRDDVRVRVRGDSVLAVDAYVL